MSVVVVGLGNAYRGDDAVGPAVADALRARLREDVPVVTCEEEPSRLIDAWVGADAVVVVDAVASGATPGTIHRLDASTQPIPAGAFRSSTHAFSLTETIEVARALGRLPRRVLVYGIEAADFRAGTELTPAVAAVVDAAAAGIADEVERLAEEGRGCTSER